MSDQPFNAEITNDDKLWAALGYPLFPVAIIALLMEEKKVRPFIKYHAVQAIAANILVAIVVTILSVTVILALCSPIVWLVLLWPAYEAYQGKYLVLPVITDFLRKQNWI